MSLLLDALKRSEQERQQTLKDRLSQNGLAPGVAQRRVPWALAIVVLLGINAALVAVWLRAPGQPTSNPVSAIQAVQPAPIAQPDVRSLANEAALAAPVAPEQTAPTGLPAEEPPSSSAPTRGQAAAVKATEKIAANDATPLDKLPDSVRRGLPALHMQIHVYADNPADRFVMINMHRYEEGDTLAAGPKVIRIRPDGVVLRYRGRSFLLPRWQ